MVRSTFVLLIMLCGDALADKATADRLAEEAFALGEKGQFAEAARKFAEAAKQDPTRPTLFCNIGITYYKAQDLPRAHLMLGRCLERGSLDPDFMGRARAELTAVEETLRKAGHTPVTIEVTPSATSIKIVELFDDEAFVGTRTVWLPFGTFHVVAHAEGYTDETVEIVASKQETLVVPITLRKPVVAKRVEPPPPLARRSRVPAYISTGVTLAAAIVAGVAFVEGRARADLARSALVPEAFEADKAAVSRWNTTLGISSALAIAGVGVSSWLWLRSRSIEIRPTANGVAFAGRF